MKCRYYTYDRNGLRQSKTVNGVTTRHIYDGQNIVMDETGSETQHFFRGTELLLPTVNGKDMEYYLSDVHGDVTKLMNTSGEITRDYQYDGFGNQLPVEEEAATPDNNPFRYCGEYYDAETGSIYLRARYYDTSTGRFLSEDTHWNVDNMIYGDEKDKNNLFPDISAILQSGNLYVYAMNNPVFWIDPSGKIVTEWDRNVMHQTQIDRIQWITDNWNSGTAEQQRAWRQEVEGYRAMWRNEYEFTDPSGITRSTITGGEIKFRNHSLQIDTSTLYIKVGYSKNEQGTVVLAPKGYRQSASFISRGIGVEYKANTQLFTTNGSGISWDVTYSKTTTYTIPFTSWDHSFTTRGGHVYGTLYDLR